MLVVLFFIITTLEANGLTLLGESHTTIKSILTFAVTYILYLVSQKEQPKKTKEIITPQNTIFVFDVHGVIFKLSTREIIKEVFKDPNNLWIITMMLRPMLCVHLLVSQLRGGVAEELIFNVPKKKPKLKWFAPKAFKLINAQVPIKKTINIIEKLKSNGYQVYILSNIGERSLKHISLKYPEIFKLFDGIMTSTHKDNYNLKKPKKEMFEKYLQTFGQKPTNLFFIDDKQANLETAKKLGMRTHRFTSSQKLHRVLTSSKAF